MPRRAPLPYADFDPTVCLNCGERFAAATRFCPQCGQRNRTHKRSVAEWIAEGLSSFFHFEGRTWNTLRDLPVPGRVVRNYLDGQRQRYVHPLRLLLFSSLICFAVVNLVDGERARIIQTNREPTPPEADQREGSTAPRVADDLQEGWANYDASEAESSTAPVERGSPVAEFMRGFREGAFGGDGSAEVDLDELEEALEEASLAEVDEVLGELDAATFGSVALDTAQAQMVRERLERTRGVLADEARALRRDHVYGVVENDTMVSRMRLVDVYRMRYVAADKARALADSLRADGFARDPLAAAAIDSFELAFAVDPEDRINSLDTLLGGEAVGVTSRQFVALTPREIVAASSLGSWYNRLFLAKFAQYFQDGSDSLNEYLFSTLTWAILLFVPLFAFGYYVLYHRRLPYYTQHLNLASFVMAFGLLLMACVVAAQAVLGFDEGLYVAFGIAFFAYVFVTEVRVYRYAWWKALLKSGVMFLYAMVAFTLATALWLAFALLLH